MSSKLPETHEFGFIFQNDYLLVLKNETGISLPTTSSLSSLKSHFIRQYFLGNIHDTSCFCAEIPGDVSLPPHLEPVAPRKVFELLGKEWYVGIVKAISVITWDRNHQFCGRCGQETQYKTGGFERTCSTCGLSFYPRISPSIIVLIKKEDHILMSRSPHFVKGAYGLIAGFVEVGESIEEAVYREVREEVGIEIKNLRYFGSQSWPFPDSLMIAFTADHAAGEIMIDTHELESANWYRYDALPGGPSNNVSIARKLIDYFIEEQQQLNK